ncbi:hypothetical protein WMY93_011510 [Mugilogobius chulae]|uniref:Cullin-associated NEDD8-dissociated protein 1 n=1 Tax=Mugilogobius chulae TaxID=88201 RepID=A0AAW0PCU7_9GOBI
MATNDLMLELQKDNIKLDEDSERKVVTMLLRLLEDKNGEVQNLAVKCLAPLVKQLRDISSMGLKTVIAELPLSTSGVNLTTGVCKKITSQLIGAMGKQEDVSVQLEALDILSDMLGRLSGTLVSFHGSLLSSLLLSRHGGHRVGEHLEKLVPMVVKLTSVEDDELTEYCFQVSQRNVTTHFHVDPAVSEVHDLRPNYNYDDDEQDDSMDVEDGFGEESDDEYSDDDDMSWKVRRSSIKCLEALIHTRRDLLLTFYSTLCPALLARFKEREENVRADVFSAFSTLLRQLEWGAATWG